MVSRDPGSAQARSRGHARLPPRLLLLRASLSGPTSHGVRLSSEQLRHPPAAPQHQRCQGLCFTPVPPAREHRAPPRSCRPVLTTDIPARNLSSPGPTGALRVSVAAWAVIFRQRGHNFNSLDVSCPWRILMPLGVQGVSSHRCTNRATVWTPPPSGSLPGTPPIPSSPRLSQAPFLVPPVCPSSSLHSPGHLSPCSSTRLHSQVVGNTQTWMQLLPPRQLQKLLGLDFSPAERG